MSVEKNERSVHEKNEHSVLGIHCITNCLYILVHEIDDVENRVLASSGRDDKRWCPITEQTENVDENQEPELGFLFGSFFVPFSTVMKV